MRQILICDFITDYRLRRVQRQMYELGKQIFSSIVTPYNQIVYMYNVPLAIVARVISDAHSKVVIRHFL